MSTSEQIASDQQDQKRGIARKSQRKARPRRTGKPARGVAAILNGLLVEKVTRSEGSRSGFTSLQAIVRQLLSKSATGDKRATTVLMRYRQRNPKAKQLEIMVIGGLPD